MPVQQDPEDYGAVYWPPSIERGLESYYGCSVSLARLHAFADCWGRDDPEQVHIPDTVFSQWYHDEVQRLSGLAEYYGWYKDGAWWYKDGEVKLHNVITFDELGEELFDDSIPVKAVKAFLNFLPGLGQAETYVHALTDGHGEDRELAIRVLGESNLPHVRNLLLPLLQSEQPKERWLSAFALARMHDEAALPVLCHILTEFLPTKQAPFIENHGWFAQERLNVPRLLDSWEDPSLVAVVRQALVATVQAEAFIQFPAHTFEHISRIEPVSWMQVWHLYQDVLIAWLGGRGAFGALVGIPFSPRRRRLAIVRMVYGYCQGWEYITDQSDFWSWMKHPELRKVMMKTMGQYYALSEEEQQQYLDGYKQDFWNRFGLVPEDKETIV